MLTSWFLYLMVVHFTMRTYGVNQEVRFVKGIWLYQKILKINFFFLSREMPILQHTCATCSQPPSYISTMVNLQPLRKYIIYNSFCNLLQYYE